MSARARTKKNILPSMTALSSKGVICILSPFCSGSAPIYSATPTRKSLLKIVIFDATAYASFLLDATVVTTFMIAETRGKDLPSSKLNYANALSSSLLSAFILRIMLYRFLTKLVSRSLAPPVFKPRVKFASPRSVL